MIPDHWRAIGALGVSAAFAAGLVLVAPQVRAAGGAINPVEAELVYTIINVTEDLAARSACPLDLASARHRAEAGLHAAELNPVFSPIADGPGVLMHEVEAEWVSREAGTPCRWASRARLDGQHGPVRRDAPGRSYSSLEAASRDARPLLATPIR